jgi:hypothetical protein
MGFPVADGVGGDPAEGPVPAVVEVDGDRYSATWTVTHGKHGLG